ncbi:MAG: hypothetical protein ACE5JU_11260 [Candidatus Binatia bacterium]
MKRDKEALKAEERRLQKLRKIVDLTAAVVWQADLTLLEAQKLIADARSRALELFPDKGETFDLIYGPRFRRLLAEKYHLQ